MGILRLAVRGLPRDCPTGTNVLGRRRGTDFSRWNSPRIGTAHTVALPYSYSRNGRCGRLTYLFGHHTVLLMLEWTQCWEVEYC